MTTRTAQCGCGRVRIAAENDPVLVGACHCDFCQKRTGSVFAVQAYFTESQCSEVSGDTTVYNGLETDGVGSEDGHSIDYHFCSTCGSTVFWRVQGRRDAPSLIGIAVGNFVDPDFPPPAREYYAKLRHRWVSPVTLAETFETFPQGEDRLSL
jgi:hypothetical protein